MRSILLLAMFLTLSGPAQACNWVKGDMARQAALSGLWAVDWLQTRYVATHDEFYERNKILGKYPTTGDVNRYFAAVIGLQWGIACILPPDARKVFQYISIGYQAQNIQRNYSLGVRLEF